MATSVDFIEYVCDQINGYSNWSIRYRKMFGEYMVYANDKPVLLVCDDTVFVKILPATEALLPNADKGFPYDGAKKHFVLDIDNRELSCKVVEALEAITPVPQKKKSKIVSN